MTQLDQRIAFLDSYQSKLLATITRGVEKESLRVTANGLLSQATHPKALGSALTHPSITTDYSEALLEFITPPCTTVEEVITTLEDIHSYVYRNINEELLWVNSMPCMLGQEADIPVAQYGTANIAKMKSIYRVGLGHRYGRFMQTIAGIHYNFSLSDEFWQALKQECASPKSLRDFKTDSYLNLIRNFRRHLWLLLYLFGSAPAVCRSFVKNREHSLQPLGVDEHTLHAPFATSLRMGDLGYQSTAQEGLRVCYNSLNSYIETLGSALTTSYPDYESIDEKGKYQQLNANLLQIENEFYSTIRPKRTTQSGEAPLSALKQRGIEYIEVRCLDLNPFAPAGVTTEQMYFMDTFLLHCLLSDSPPADDQENQHILLNQQLAVYQGRDPALTLFQHTGRKPLTDWATELFEELKKVATMLDQQQATDYHSHAVSSYQSCLTQPEQIPSAKLLEMMKSNDRSYFEQAMLQAEEHRRYFMGRPLTPEKENQFKQWAEISLAEQKQLESSEDLTLDEFLEHYFTQYQQLNL